MKKIRVMVLMGGRSDERRVSMMTGKNVVNNLSRRKYEVVELEIKIEGNEWLDELRNIKPDVVFLALHGKYGEDGCIQGLLDFLGVPYTGCGVLASAIGMDKMMFRKVMEKEGILMPKLTSSIPCVVKPVDNGSSVGVSIVKKKVDFKKAVKLAEKYSNRVVIEEYIKGIEVSCGVLGNKKVAALPVVEIRPKKDFFDYEAKYTDGMCEEVCPANISGELTKKVQETAVRVFKTIGGRGFGRVDMIIRDDLPYVLEINTIPGLTPNSLLPKEAKAAGMSYSELLDKMIELALG